MGKMINIFRKVGLIYHFISGRNKLFGRRYADAKRHFEKVVSIEKRTRSELEAEAILFLAICEYETGGAATAVRLTESALKVMKGSAVYAKDDINYVGSYMGLLMNVSEWKAEFAEFDITRVRQSLRRDFPMSVHQAKK